MNAEAEVIKIENRKLKAELKYCLEIFDLVEKLQKQGNTLNFIELKKRIKTLIN